MIIVVIIGLLAAMLIPACRHSARSHIEAQVEQFTAERFQVIAEMGIRQNRARVVKDVTTGHEYLFVYGSNGSPPSVTILPRGANNP